MMSLSTFALPPAGGLPDVYGGEESETSSVSGTIAFKTRIEQRDIHIPRTVSLRHLWRSWSQGRPASLCCQQRGVWNGKNGKSNEHLTLPEANMRHSGESSRTLAGSLRISKNILNTNHAAACSCVRIIMACLINILSSYASSPM